MIPALLLHMTFRYYQLNSNVLNGLSNRRPIVAEERLMLALLTNAIEDFHNYASAEDRKEKVIYQQARQWIEERNRGWFLSFDRVCESLFLNPDQLRRGLLRQHQRKPKALNTLTAVQ